MRILFVVSMFIFTLFTSVASVIEETGVYKGKNIWIKNHYDADKSRYCVTNVYVNDEKVLTAPDYSSFEIDLASLEIAMNSPIKISIYYYSGCEAPIFINRTDMKIDAMFSFRKIEVTQDRVIWTVIGEAPVGEYHLDHWQNGEWFDVGMMPEHGSISEDHYDMKVKHFAGENKYRVRYIEYDSITITSPVAVFTNTKKPLPTFHPFKVDDYLHFDRYVKYVIKDVSGKVILKGEGPTADCRALEHKKYYTLLFNNQEKSFYKNKNKKK